MGVRRLRMIDVGARDVEKSTSEAAVNQLSKVGGLEYIQGQVRDSANVHVWLAEQLELHGEEELGTVVNAISSTVYIAPEGSDPDDRTQWVTYLRKPAQVFLKKGLQLPMGAKVLFRRRKGVALQKSSLLVRLAGDVGK